MHVLVYAKQSKDIPRFNQDAADSHC